MFVWEFAENLITFARENNARVISMALGIAPIKKTLSWLSKCFSFSRWPEIKATPVYVRAATHAT